jgi:hypothetical protein
MRADVDVLRVAGDRPRRADVRRRCQRDHVRDRVEAELARQVKDERRHGQTDNVVDEERRQDAGEEDGDRQEAHGGPDPSEGQGRDPLEEAGEAEEAHHDHHAKEQGQRSIVDALRADGLLEADEASHQHQRGTDESYPRAIHAEPRHLADGQSDIRERKQDAGQPDRQVILQPSPRQP